MAALDRAMPSRPGGILFSCLRDRACADPYNPGGRATTGGLPGAGTGAVIGAIAGGHGAGIGAAVGGGLGAVAGAATTPGRAPRHTYRRHDYTAHRPC